MRNHSYSAPFSQVGNIAKKLKSLQEFLEIKLNYKNITNIMSMQNEAIYYLIATFRTGKIAKNPLSDTKARLA